MAAKIATNSQASESTEVRIQKETGTYAQAVANVKCIKEDHSNSKKNLIEEETFLHNRENINCDISHEQLDANHLKNMKDTDKTTKNIVASNMQITESPVQNGENCEVQNDSIESDKAAQRNQYIDAPPPKVNPWTVNKNAARVITDQLNDKTCAAQPSLKERERELTLHQVHHNEIKIPTRQTAPSVKEKRRQRKVSEFVDVSDWPTLGQVSLENKNAKNVVSRQTSQESLPSTSSLAKKVPKIQHFQEDEDDVVENDGSPDHETSLNGIAAKCHKKKGSKQKWVPLDIEPVKQERRKSGKGGNDKSPRYRRDLDDRSESRKDGGTKEAEKLLDSQSGESGAATSNSDTGQKKELSDKDRRGRNFRGPRRGRGSGRGYNARNRSAPIEKFNSNNAYISSFGLDAQCSVQPYIPPYATTFYFPNNATQFSPMYNIPLQEMIRNQIDYYFSEDNLRKDLFMRQKMDSEGYLPISLVASFNLVKKLTQELDVIIQALHNSTEVEIDQNNFRIRAKRKPEIWPLSDNNILNSNLHPDVPDFVPGKPYVTKTRLQSKEPHSNNSQVTCANHFADAGTDADNEAEPETDQMIEKLSNGFVDDINLHDEFHSKDITLTDHEFEKSSESHSPNCSVVSKQSEVSHVPNASIPVENWTQIRRRTKSSSKTKDRKEEQVRVVENREELEFQFDEELDSAMNGRKNTFTDWSDDSDYEFSDHEVNKIIIVTQTPPPKKHDGYDRTGDWIRRSKMTQDLAKIINDGLFYYEQDLWKQMEMCDKQYKTVELISQEAFKTIAPPEPLISNKAVPPPPPPLEVIFAASEPRNVRGVPSNQINHSVQRVSHVLKDHRVAPRFFPVVKEDRPTDSPTPYKQKNKIQQQSSS